MVVNNGYTNKEVEAEIKKFLRDNTVADTIPPRNMHKIYYHNYMNPMYKRDEYSLREIIDRNTKLKKPEDRIKLIIYYKTQKTRDMIMRNNLGPKI